MKQIMLRAKQISSLSQSARSFIFSGSRCNAADGSSCTCTEDEASFPKNQHTSSEVTLPQKTPTLLSKTKAKAETVISGDSVKVVEYQKAESVSYSDSVRQILSIPRCSPTSDCENDVSDDVHAVQKDPVHKSSFVADHFFKAGIAAVSFLSDLANSKIPVLDGSLLLPPNCMVDSTRPISGIKSTNVKLLKKENFSKVHGKPSAEIAGGSNSTNHYHGPKGKDERVGSVKISNQFPGIVTGNASQTQSNPSEYCDAKRFLPQRSKTDPYSVSKSKSYGQASETKVVGGIAKGYGSMDGIQNLTRNTKMQTGAAPLARQSLNARNIVERAFNILQRLKWGPAAEEALVNLNFLLDAYQANQILKHLQDHSVALGFFYWLKGQARFKHDEHTYTTMVGILGRARQFGAINKLLDEMVRDGCMPNVVTYNRLIHSYGRANYMNAAVNVFYQMQKAGCKPDRVTYCTLIDIHAKAGYLDVAMDMYQRMQAAGLAPDTFTYSVIINCLGKAGHLNAAYKLFCEMVDKGCVPNLVTYNIMIALQAKARNYHCALKLYRDMQAAGFKPDNVTYSIVMEVLGHCGHLEEAEVVFDEMKRKDWIPDEPVYGLLVDLWGKAGNVDKAQAWYQAMLNADLCPNVPTCNSLLSAFLRSHRFSDAYNLVQSMLRLGLHPSLQTYTLLLSCCTETQSACDMGFCCELMAITGHPAHAFLLSMPASGPDGQNVRDHASNFLDLMHSEDRESKRGLVDAVVDFLHKSGLKEEAGSVWEVAAQRNVYPDAVTEKGSSYWLINLHVMSDGTAVTALSRTLAWFRKQLLASGVGPNRIDIVTGWGRRSRVTGSSLVRQSVQDLLHIFSFPFSTGNGNSGCFVGCGEPLNRWLLHSYVERMHLL